MKPELSKLIDSRNLDIWDAVSRYYEIDVIFHDNKEHRVNYVNKTATILIPFNQYSPDAFTHELLHLYLEVKKFRLSVFTLALLKENNIINAVLPEGLFHHISNTIDHVKMLPIFLTRGYNRKLFILDFEEFKCTENQIELIELGLSKFTHSWNSAVDMYIGKFFAIKSCPNNTFNYSQHISRLKTASPSLYELLDNFWSVVLSCDLETSTFNEYLTWAGEFTDNLMNWIVNEISGNSD